MSLRAYLEAGASLASVPELDRLAEAVVVDRRERSHEWLVEAARSCRQLADGLNSDPGHENLARVLNWAAEAYEDEDLASRFEQALPRDVLGQLLATVEQERHPHRLIVTQGGSFSCAACGDAIVAGAGIAVQGGGGITYCRHCLAIAAAAVSDAAIEIVEANSQATSTPGGSRRGRAPRAVSVLVMLVVLASGTGMASAGRLPQPIQTIVQRTLERLGLEIPSGSRADKCSPRRAAAPAPGCTVHGDPASAEPGDSAGSSGGSAVTGPASSPAPVPELPVVGNEAPASAVYTSGPGAATTDGSPPTELLPAPTSPEDGSGRGSAGAVPTPGSAAASGAEAAGGEAPAAPPPPAPPAAPTRPEQNLARVEAPAVAPFDVPDHDVSEIPNSPAMPEEPPPPEGDPANSIRGPVEPSL